MSKNQWWADNKKAAIWLVIWAISAVWAISTSKHITVWYVLLMLVEGLIAGFCIGDITITWGWMQRCYETEEARPEPIVSEQFDMVTVDVPRGAKFSNITWDMACKVYEGIRTEHTDWKTWDQLNDTAQWLLMAHVDAGSRMTIQLAEQFNNEDEEETA